MTTKNLELKLCLQSLITDLLMNFFINFSNSVAVSLLHLCEILNFHIEAIVELRNALDVIREIR